MPIAEITHSEYKNAIEGKSILRRVPLHAMFELTYRCNLHCVMCYNAPQDKKELTTEQVFLVLDQLSEEGCLYLGLTGGELMIRKDIFEILEHAALKGFLMTLKSNATLLTPERIDRIKRLGINRMDVSFHGADAEVFDGITQVRGSYERCKAVVIDLKQRGFHVKLNMTVMRQNLHQVEEARAFARSAGVSFKYCTEVTPRTDGNQSPLQYRISPKVEMAMDAKFVPPDPKQKLEFYRMRLKAPSPRSELFTCGVGKSQLIITPYGEARLCLDIEEPSYSILEMGLEGAWQKLLAFVDAQDLGRWQCPEGLRPFCTIWCPAKGLLEGGSLYSCTDHCQEKARINKEEYERLERRAREENWILSGGFDQKREIGCEFEQES